MTHDGTGIAAVKPRGATDLLEQPGPLAILSPDRARNRRVLQAIALRRQQHSLNPVITAALFDDWISTGLGDATSSTLDNHHARSTGCWIVDEPIGMLPGVEDAGHEKALKRFGRLLHLEGDIVAATTLCDEAGLKVTATVESLRVYSSRLASHVSQWVYA